ncbi:MAG TPA: hypothetical protein VFT62_08775 [Mycobacteriales bacterium]|nr:hypothetical protein [Mycobacteriales bacterium]
MKELPEQLFSAHLEALTVARAYGDGTTSVASRASPGRLDARCQGKRLGMTMRSSVLLLNYGAS